MSEDAKELAKECLKLTFQILRLTGLIAAVGFIIYKNFIV